MTYGLPLCVDKCTNSYSLTQMYCVNPINNDMFESLLTCMVTQLTVYTYVIDSTVRFLLNDYDNSNTSEITTGFSIHRCFVNA